MKTKHLFLTGFPGVGKTTLTKTLFQPFLSREDIQCIGFYTDEIREQRKGRVGFEVISIVDGSKAALAGIGLLPHTKVPVVGKFRVDVDGFEKLAMSTLNLGEGKTLCVVDEIGKMELYSLRFKSRIIELFGKENVTLLCTVPLRSTEFVDRLKDRDDVEVVEVTIQNRDHLDGVLSGKLSEMVGLN